ncbi:unnamed protein product [Amaranthus hypochondriacus]
MTGQIIRSKGFNMMVMVVMIMTMIPSTVVNAYYTPSTSYTPPATTWKLAHATFYGDETASETMGGACGYGNLHESGYGLATAALSSVMFNNGKGCGTCYELKCVNSKWCLSNAPSIKITATNLCPPNWYKPTDNGGWCNPPRSHFDLSKPMFMKIAQVRGGIVPVNFKRISCVRQGGIRLRFQGNPYWLLVYVMNVGGGGDISQMWVKGSQTGWVSMSRNWGASFQAFAKLGGQPLTFKLMNGRGEVIVAYNICPSYWSTGKTYQANVNFR